MSENGGSDDLIAKIKAALGGGGAREDDDGDDEPRGGKVPYDRFQAVARERAALKRQLGEALSLVERERASAVKAIEEMKAATAKEVTALAAQYDERLAADDGQRPPDARIPAPKLPRLPPLPLIVPGRALSVDQVPREVPQHAEDRVEA